VDEMTNESSILHDEVERKLKLGYLYGEKDPTRRNLDKLQSVMTRFQENGLELMPLLQDVADTINRMFWLKEVTIGLKDADGLYRYKVMCGLRQDAWQAHRRLAYTLEDFFDPRHFKGRQISKFTKVFLAEDKPYVDGEEDTFTRPILLKAVRSAPDNCIEGDYLDVHILGDKGELLGWIEVSGTKNGNFPDPVAIRWIEFVALVIGTFILYDKRAREERAGEERRRSFANLARKQRGLVI
jgi:hypothetical protein